MNEKVSLTLHSPHVHTLCTIGRFVSQPKAVVTSVVLLLDDVSILDGLDAASGEVAHVFDYPLEVLLDPELAHSEKFVPVGSEDWPYEAELYVSAHRFCVHMCVRLNVAVSFVGQNFKDNSWIGTTYCLHRFPSTASLIKGLPADILVRHPPYISHSMRTLDWHIHIDRDSENRVRA